MTNLKSIEVPVAVPLYRVPPVHCAIHEALDALAQLPAHEGDKNTAPYLEVRVQPEGPEPGIRHKIENALVGKNLRLAKIDVRYRSASSPSEQQHALSPAQLNELQPLDILHQVYQKKYGSPIPEDLLKLFQHVAQQVNEIEI